MRDVTLLSMKNKSVQNCRFFHHAKFHCIMTTLNKLFKIEFERWGGGNGKEPKYLHVADDFDCTAKICGLLTLWLILLTMDTLL